MNLKGTCTVRLLLAQHDAYRLHDEEEHDQLALVDGTCTAVHGMGRASLECRAPGTACNMGVSGVALEAVLVVEQAQPRDAIPWCSRLPYA